MDSHGGTAVIETAVIRNVDGVIARATDMATTVAEVVGGIRGVTTRGTR